MGQWLASWRIVTILLPSGSKDREQALSDSRHPNALEPRDLAHEQPLVEPDIPDPTIYA
jgi:hypothetical protein